MFWKWINWFQSNFIIRFWQTGRILKITLMVWMNWKRILHLNWFYWVLPRQHDCVPDKLYQTLLEEFNLNIQHTNLLLATSYGGHSLHMDYEEQEYFKQNISITGSHILWSCCLKPATVHLKNDKPIQKCTA